MARRINKPMTSDGILDAANLSSPWKSIGLLEDISISVEGIVAGDVLQMEGSMSTANPPAAADTHAYGSTITADGIYVVEPGPDLLRGTLTATAGGGDVSIRYGGTVRR